MATHISVGTILKNFIRMLPGAVIIVATLSSGSCGSRNPFGVAASSTNTGSVTVTPTSTASPGVVLFVSNYADGTVSSFTRNTKTGALTFAQNINAGATNGPQGLAVSQSNNALFATNFSDGNIYEYSVNTANGMMSPLATPSISNGGSSGPGQILINPSGSMTNQFAWVAGGLDGTINAYSVAVGGQLTAVSTNPVASGLSSPFGMAFQTTGSGNFLYVADTAAGLIYSYTVNSDGTLTQNGSPVFNLGGGPGSPALLAVGTDSSGNSALYVTDNTSGLISSFGLANGSLVFIANTPSPSPNSLFGMALATFSKKSQFVFVTNQSAPELWSFSLPSAGHPLFPSVCSYSGVLSFPTGLAIDSSSSFAYVTNQSGGTISQFSLNKTSCPTAVTSVPSESSLNTGSGPFGVVLTH
ncbi:MAG TPA: beta-propeller fold lactonase family protein [Candidatus Binataceae bacterium]|nr:beta-propeller fold lactonase family protein [Candidatus Binataceae bacterium]